MRELMKLKRSRLLILLPAAAVILLIARLSPFAAEYIFARGIYRVLSVLIGFLTGFIPLSIAELVIILTPVIIFGIFVIFIIKLIKSAGDRKQVLARSVLNVFCFVSTALFLFVLLCGVNYYRYDFEKYCGFETGEHTVAELKELCLYLKDRVEETKALIPEKYLDDEDVVVQEDFSYTADEAKKAMSSLADTYPALGYGTGSAKEVLLSRYMSYGGIVGIFVPFTMEANVNTDVADYNRPADTCHELAHMRGFMKEEEANYIAYLACISHADPLFQYSGYMLAFIHSTNALYDYDAGSYGEIMEALSDDVKADMIYENGYWDELRTDELARKAEAAVTAVNDTYLKVNGQESGVKSYGRMVDLLLGEYFH